MASSINQVESKATSKVKAKTLQKSNNTNSARNLCTLEWIEVNPGGLAVDIKMYFDGQSKEDIKKWKEKEKAVKTANTRAIGGQSSAATAKTRREDE